MRGEIKRQNELFSCTPIESRIPKTHILRKIRSMVEPILVKLSPDFDSLYSETGRPSIPPEYLLKALLLQVLYTIRSERLLVEQLDYNMLYRWFVGMGADDKIWEETVFSKNRDRLLEGSIADRFFTEVVAEANRQDLVSKEHFSVDGTLIEAWASFKSFQKKEDDGKKTKSKDDDDTNGRNGGVDFKGEQRTNQTHESKSDPEAKIYKKSKGATAKLCFMGHVLMENRNGLAVNSRLSQATGTAERDAAVEMATDLPGESRKTLCGDKNYDESKCVGKLRNLKVTPHVAQNEHAKRTSSIDGRTTRHPGYEVSIRKRKRIEEIFGWLKDIGLMRKTHFRGLPRVEWRFTFALGVYNLVRMSNLCFE